MFAGYFTSGSALTSSILELSRNPQVFHKMEEELLDVGLMKEDHGATDEEVTQSEVDLRLIHKLTYMEQVLKETLRLRPPVLGGYRRARETFQLGVSTELLLWFGRVKEFSMVSKILMSSINHNYSDTGSLIKTFKCFSSMLL